jgi:tetratricopeptide (TPR) repeat protein
MGGLIRKEEEMYENCNFYHHHVEGTNKVAVHPEVQTIERELKNLYNEGNLSGLNLYLYGLVLKEQERLTEARNIFIQALNKFPYLWSCWLELCRIIES